MQGGSAYGMIEVYSMCYPMVYTEALDVSASNRLMITATKIPVNYRQNVNFGYIYYTNNYIGERVMAVFKQINQTIYNYLVPYQPFAYTPSTSNVMFVFRQYDSVSIPFLNCQTVQNYNFITGITPQMMIGYIFPLGSPVTFNSDIFFFNESYSGCPDSQFLFYIQLY